jgi:hypothetical protein
VCSAVSSSEQFEALSGTDPFLLGSPITVMRAMLAVAQAPELPPGLWIAAVASVSATTGRPANSQISPVWSSARRRWSGSVKHPT